ncbi:hypothetical protein ABPG72_008827 [Tetrahymena utriculariae]
MTFYRAYSCNLVKKFNQTSVTFNIRTYIQTLPFFWNSNGIQSGNSFCFYQLINSNLQIKIYNYQNVTSNEFELNGVKEILQVSQVSQSIDIQYLFYIQDNENQIILYFMNDTFISKFMLSEKPKLIKANLFTQQMNKCLYKIDNMITNMQINVKQNIIFCIQDNEKDEFEDIQTNGGNTFVVNTRKNTYVIENNLITQILPNTNVYLYFCFKSFTTTYELVQDISEKVYDVVNFPKFNYNFQIDEFNKIMSYRDPLSENEQRVEYIYEIKFKYGEYIQKFAQQDNNITSLYLSYDGANIMTSKINDQDSIYEYFSFDLRIELINLPDNTYITQVLYFQSAITFIISFSFSLLILRRSKKIKEIRAQTEDLIFKQVIQISKQQFQNKYQLDYKDSIGCGSFGQVYKVKNKYKDIIKNPDILKNMPDYYACKQIHMQQDGQNQRTQIIYEIEVLERLKKYENVIGLQNYVIEERFAYLVLDLAESTLQDQINSKQANSEKFDESEIVKILSQIGITLALIYTEEGIAHRDIKPSNILIKDANYYLSDFGCAEKLFESEAARNNLVMGTLKWMSPELREMKKNQVVDYFKSDIFSLGMLLLYMLTLTDISSVNSDEFTKNQKLRIMKNYSKHISNEIILLINKMLETNPDNRPDSAIVVNTIKDIENNFKLKNKSKQQSN